ncbi:hypothetical protein [Actinomadura harenae]|uniref:Uncharacterized protein n=1 Tax=Actinomadura harenae TaxID=2483351 RepID=A0A3M2MEY0_9ACTN|nr:hypothetical protein [Actinomadura harenae]RMI47580.1 hypothetical protein EBO15_01375 [Actinomadura harenae]
MTDFQDGEIVDVTLKGVRIARPTQIDAIVIRDEHGDKYALPPQAAITRVAPAGWPPLRGDLWRDRDGALWLADEEEGDAFPRLYSAIGVYAPGEALRQFSPWTLVRSEQATEGPQS